MKRCPSGAVLPAASKCVNLYGTSNVTTVDGTQKEKTTVYITLTGTSEKAASKSDTSRVKLNGALQLPAELKSSMSIATASSRRLSNGRKLTETKQVLAFTVENTGKSSVSPSAVGEQLKQMVTSSNPELTKAMSSVGGIDAQAGVNVDQSSTKVVTRAQAAKDKRAAQAGITTLTTTTAEATTAAATTAAGTTAAGTTAAGTTAAGTTAAGTTAAGTTTSENVGSTTSGMSGTSEVTSTTTLDATTGEEGGQIPSSARGSLASSFSALGLLAVVIFA
ncbi:unnamed protein product [Effrenium voratum]|nr:unnamed protein product [Effrenium voratum]